MNRFRFAGLLYLVPMVLGPFSMLFVPSRVLVPADAAATARALVDHEALYRLGLASDLVIVGVEVVLTAVLFELFLSAGRTLSRVAAAARFSMAAVQAGNVVVGFAALQQSSLDALDVHRQAVSAWEVLFALHCLALAVLLVRSGHRALGAGLALAGAGYAVQAFGTVLLPSAAPVLATVVGLTGVVGEVPFVFWLVFRRRA